MGGVASGSCMTEPGKMGEQFDGAGGGGADVVTSAVGFPILICVSSASKVDAVSAVEGSGKKPEWSLKTRDALLDHSARRK